MKTLGAISIAVLMSQQAAFADIPRAAVTVAAPPAVVAFVSTADVAKALRALKNLVY